jgi:hypothetical protein
MECSRTITGVIPRRVVRAGLTSGQGLSGPANAAASLRHEALALMPP